MTKKQISITIDDQIAKESKNCFESMGISFSAGIELYLRSVINNQAIPFPIKTKESKIEYEVVSLKD